MEDANKWGEGGEVEGRRRRGRGIQLYKVELGLLGHDLIDVRGEEGVGLAYFGADGALDGGFDLGLLAGCYAASVSHATNDSRFSAGIGEAGVLLLFEHN